MASLQDAVQPRAIVFAARSRNARLRPNSSQSISNPNPPSTASHGHRSVDGSRLRASARNAAADVRRWTPDGFADIRQRQRIDHLAIARRAPARFPARRRKIAADVAVDGERQRALILVHHANARRIGSLSSATFTVPTVPACTSQRRNVPEPSSAGCWRSAAASPAHISSTSAAAGIRSRPSSAIRPARRSDHAARPRASATANVAWRGAKTSAESSCTSLVRRPAPSAVSDRQRSSFTADRVPRAPESASLSREARSRSNPLAADRRREAVEHHDVRLHLRIVIRGRLEHGVHLRVGRDQRLQQLRLGRIHHHVQRLSAGSSITARSSCGKRVVAVSNARFQIPAALRAIA